MCVLLNNIDFVYQVIKWTQHGDWGERISRLFRSIIAAYIYWCFCDRFEGEVQNLSCSRACLCMPSYPSVSNLHRLFFSEDWVPNCYTRRSPLIIRLVVPGHKDRCSSRDLSHTHQYKQQESKEIYNNVKKGMKQWWKSGVVKGVYVFSVFIWFLFQPTPPHSLGDMKFMRMRNHSVASVDYLSNMRTLSVTCHMAGNGRAQLPTFLYPHH